MVAENGCVSDSTETLNDVENENAVEKRKWNGDSESDKWEERNPILYIHRNRNGESTRLDSVIPYSS